MTRWRLFLAMVCVLMGGEFAAAQSPGMIYTWAGTGNTRNWLGNLENTDNFVQLSNPIAGQLTVTEIGDEFSPGTTDPAFYGKGSSFEDHYDYVKESTTASGGIDLTGLQYVEIDISHNGTGNVNVQPFIKTGRNSTYTWFGPGPDYTPSGTPWVIPPGSTPTTIRIPINQLTPDLQAYNRSIGIKVGDHVDQGYLTWTVSEVRSVGTPLISRILASHDVGSSDSGLNGAYVNFENAAVVGNDLGQNQTGLSQNISGPGSLQWTDKGTQGVSGAPSGAAITWGNGTAYYGNSFYQRPADFSNYNHVLVRMSATDVVPGGGGTLGVQAFFQTGNYEAFQTTSGGTVNQFGGNNVPVDGQFHDLVFPIYGVTNRDIVPAFGINLFSHLNDLTINIDQVQFINVAGIPTDYNGNGTVDAGDYVLWRKSASLQSEVVNPGSDTPQDYTEWRARFGKNTASGSLGNGTVPEPTEMSLLLLVAVFQLLVPLSRRKRR